MALFVPFVGNNLAGWCPKEMEVLGALVATKSIELIYVYADQALRPVVGALA